MSYTPENERLHDVVDTLVAEIRRYCDVVDARILSRDYNEDHINEISAIAAELVKLKPRLVRLI